MCYESTTHVLALGNVNQNPLSRYRLNTLKLTALRKIGCFVISNRSSNVRCLGHVVTMHFRHDHIEQDTYVCLMYP